MKGKFSQIGRKVIFAAHLWLGLLAGLYFVLLGLTGSLLVFRVEIDSLLNRSVRTVQVPVQGKTLPVETWVAAVRSQAPGSQLNTITLPSAPGEPAVIAYAKVPTQGRAPFLSTFRNRREAFVNTYSGQILDERPAGSAWLSIVRNLHEDLLLDGVGHLVGQYGSLLLTILIVSGIWLWVPSVGAWKTQFKQRITVKKGANLRRRLYDWHNVFGFWSLPVLFLITITGATHYWMNQTRAAVFAATGTVLAVRAEDGNGGGRRPGGNRPGGIQTVALDLDGVLKAAEKVRPQLVTRQIQIPRREGQALRVVKESVGSHHVRAQQVVVQIDPRSGNVRDISDPDGMPLGVQVMNWLMPIHYGQWGPGFTFYAVKILHFLVGLAPLGLFVTGVWKWWDRLKAKRATSARRRLHGASGKTVGSTEA